MVMLHKTVLVFYFKIYFIVLILEKKEKQERERLQIETEFNNTKENIRNILYYR